MDCSLERCGAGDSRGRAGEPPSTAAVAQASAHEEEGACPWGAYFLVTGTLSSLMDGSIPRAQCGQGWCVREKHIFPRVGLDRLRPVWPAPSWGPSPQAREGRTGPPTVLSESLLIPLASRRELALITLPFSSLTSP